MSETSNNEAAYQVAAPNADLKTLQPLVGTWRVSGGVDGTVRYEWMEGGYFLIQHFDFDHAGHRVKGIEYIGHLQRFGEEPSADIKSRVYDTIGNTLDYTYEVKDGVLTIWGGDRGSPAYYQGTFSPDGNSCRGGWVYPGGGGYESNMTRIA